MRTLEDSKELGTDLHSLKVSSLLSSFPSSFRLYVQRILFICQPFQRTKHCSALCNIYQRAKSSMGLGFGLELGLTVFRSVRHIIHYRGLILSSCLVLCLSSCLLLCIISILFFWVATLNPGSENIIHLISPSRG